MADYVAVPSEEDKPRLAKDNQADDSSFCKVYKRRWLMLAIFMACGICSVMQWPEYAVITDVVVEFYGVSFETANWCSLLYLLLYMPFAFPAVYIMQKLGVKKSVILSMAGTCVGAWIKVGSVSPDRIWVLFIGTCVVAAFQVTLLSVPAAVAAIWFGANQVSTACSLGVVGLQIGSALGFILPPMLVNIGRNKDTLVHDMNTMNIGCAILCTVVLLIAILFIETEPPTPPSTARLGAVHQEINITASVWRLTKDFAFVMFLIAYGINVGVIYVLSTLLNQIVLKYYTGAEEDVGRIGLLIIVSGMFGSIISGFTLDKFQNFKSTTVVMFFFCLLGMLAFTLTLTRGIEAVYASSMIIGFFSYGVFSVGVEVAVEMTYPEPETTTTAILLFIAQAFGIAFTYLYSHLFSEFGDIWANGSLCVLLLISNCIVGCLRIELRRQTAQTKIAGDVIYPLKV